MKLFSRLLVLGLAAEVTLASNWFSKSVYNKWHETELERWLSDHNVPYPTPADRKDLENLVKDNWQSKIAQPYNDWDSTQLTSYLKLRGVETKDTAAANKDGLVAQVKNYWYETEDKADDAWASVRDWIFDSWTESQLKAFCDKHDIPVPQPRKRDTILQKARSNYETVAKKVGETASYPGNWLYETWSESDLKEFLDSNGIPAPQPSSRDKLIASVRRNARIASLKMADMQASMTKSASDATQTLSDQLLDSWSDSEIKAWADKNGIRVPQGSKRNELLAIARKHRAQLTGDNVSDPAKSAFGAATSSANNQYAKASDDAQLMAEDAFNQATGTWSESRLKAYLDSRGVPVPQSSKKDELLAAVRLNRHKAATGWSAWTFDTWTLENLKAYLATSGNKAAEKASKQTGATREQLLSAAQAAYAEASKTGGTSYASVTSYLAKQTDAAKDSIFDTWSESELKNYLDSYGFKVPQGSTKNQLVAWARNQRNYFQYGTTTPQGTLWAKLQNGAQWVLDQLSIGAAAGRKQASYQAEKAGDSVKEGATYANNRAGEATQNAYDKVKEEL
ncbi:putative stress response protein ish1 [Hyaloscypha bicolor E]|uniref:Putative stress response protein ish1 n=1 Tax=Hyaloscypha bicolor E TaxID=1095630 RepID=A0A2J6SYV8_9HELO|nr:putative stress response protein ish1 [Hyaloscypha bicolor E]PMD55955.1 putative stress response protein ish1 [Hyaloscypha bicolor E]